MKVDKEIKRFFIGPEATCFDAMKVINETEERTCLQVDKEGRLLKVVSDGDIRRALLKGLQINDKVSKVHKREPYIIKDDQNINEAKKYISSRITLVPIIDN